MFSVLAFDYTVPTVTHWQGYLTFAVFALLGLAILWLAMKGMHVLLIIIAIFFVAGAWPARNFVQSRIDQQVQKRLTEVQAECRARLGTADAVCK